MQQPFLYHLDKMLQLYNQQDIAFLSVVSDKSQGAKHLAGSLE